MIPPKEIPNLLCPPPNPGTVRRPAYDKDNNILLLISCIPYAYWRAKPFQMTNYRKIQLLKKAQMYIEFGFLRGITISGMSISEALACSVGCRAFILSIYEIKCLSELKTTNEILDFFCVPEKESAFWDTFYKRSWAALRRIKILLLQSIIYDLKHNQKPL